MAARNLRTLELLDAEIRAAVEVVERRSDSMETKAGFCLGFAGVLAGILLRTGAHEGAWAFAALGADFWVAALSLFGYRIRSFPVIRPGQLSAHIEDDELSARLVMFDTRMAVYEKTSRDLGHKEGLVNAALTCLLLAVTVTAIAAGRSL